MAIPLQKLVRFVPQMVVDLYSKDNQPQRLKVGPVYGKIQAATGFFDVSGFSKLGDKLNSEQKVEQAMELCFLSLRWRYLVLG